MNPIEIIYCWQALLVAITCVGITSLVKAIVDTWRGARELRRRSTMPPPEPQVVPGPEPAKKATPLLVGKEMRQQSVLLNKFVLPMLPVLVGVLIAVLLPLRPEALTVFVEAHVDVPWHAMAIYGLWGAACGQFALALFDKAKDALQAVQTVLGSLTGRRPPPPAPPAPVVARGQREPSEERGGP